MNYNLGQGTRVEIYNTLGEIIFQSNINNQTSNIDLTLQPNGIYFVRCTEGEKTFTEKIIIQK